MFSGKQVKHLKELKVFSSEKGVDSGYLREYLLLFCCC